MPFTVKDWQDSLATPLSAAALEDLEDRLSDYTDDGDLSTVALLPVTSGRNEIGTGAGVVGLRVRQATTTVPGAELFAGADTQPRLSLNANSELKFGAGGSTAPDVTLVHGAAGRLDITGSLWLHQTTTAARPAGVIDLYDYATATGVSGAAPMVHFEKHERQVGTGPAAGLGHALAVTSYYGTGSVAAVGTSHALTSEQHIDKAGNNANEYTPFGLYFSNRVGAATGGDGTNPGRMWLTDWIAHGPIGVQPNLFLGQNLLMANHYNGSPLNEEARGVSVSTFPGHASGAAEKGTEFAAAATYPCDVGIVVAGAAGDSQGSLTRLGWTTGIRVGGTGTWATSSRIGTAVELKDWFTRGLYVSGRHASASAGAPAFEVAAGAGMAIVPDGVRGKVKAGALGDGDFDNDADGNWGVNTTANQIEYRSGGAWHTTAKTFRTVHTFALKGTVASTDTVPTFFVGEASGQAASLVSARYKIRSGTALTFRLLKNGAEFGYGTAGTPLSADTTAAETNSTQALAEDDEIELDLVGGGTATDMTVTLVFEHVV